MRVPSPAGGCGRVGGGGSGPRSGDGMERGKVGAGGGRCPWARRCGLAFCLVPLVIYYASPLLFLLPPSAFLLRSGSSQAAGAGSAQPPSVLPPSPHPSLFLKNVGSGVQPPALAASLPARSSPSPPPPSTGCLRSGASGFVPPPARLCHLHPGVPGCGPGERSHGAGSSAREDPSTQVRSQWGLFSTLVFSCCFTGAESRPRGVCLSGRLSPQPQREAAVVLGGAQRGGLGTQSRIWGLTELEEAGGSIQGWGELALCRPHVPCAGGVEKCGSSLSTQDAPSSWGCIPLKCFWGGLRGAVPSLAINHSSPPVFLMHMLCYGPVLPVDLKTVSLVLQVLVTGWCFRMDPLFPAHILEDPDLRKLLNDSSMLNLSFLPSNWFNNGTGDSFLPLSIKITIVVVYSIVCIVGLVGNCSVMYVIVR